MGPRPGGRGEIQDIANESLRSWASMGPRPGGRGEDAGVCLAIHARWLQWGRAPEGAESPRSTAGRESRGRFNGAAPRRARRDRAR